MMGPSLPRGVSRRGIGSGHHVGQIDHRLGSDDLPNQEGHDPEALVAFPQRFGTIAEDAGRRPSP